jgi:multisubunit Na+/H+ antiporter MnhC subunit
VLPPLDTHRKLITSFTAVLFPFVAYLLTLVSLFQNRHGFDIQQSGFKLYFCVYAYGKESPFLTYKDGCVA